MIKLFGISLAISLIVGCTIVPTIINDKSPSFDSSTPKQYSDKNSGFIGFDDNGDGILTLNAVNKYNNLIEIYGPTYKKERGISLNKNDGISDFVDIYGNNLFKIQKQYLSYFIELNQWQKSKKKTN